MKKTRFAYYQSKGLVFMLPIGLLLGGLIIQNYGAAQSTDNVSLETILAWLCYLLGFPSLVWAFTQLQSPPVFSGTEETVTFQPSPFFPSTTYKWIDLESVSYTKGLSQNANTSFQTRKTLVFEMASGQKETLDLSRFELSFEEIRDLISDYAPHIEWTFAE